MIKRTASEVLGTLDGEFASVGEGITYGRYSFWIGSGISLGVVPGLNELLEKVLMFLQDRISDDRPDCRFRLALRKVLKAGGLSDSEIHKYDLSQPVAGWPGLEELLHRLGPNYSRILSVTVDGEDAEDYLLWEALDVRATYAAGHLEPGTPHLCVAALMLEGVVNSAVSANWDGLIEKAMRHLNGNLEEALRVLVDDEDFRLPEVQSDLIKLHGCAVRAKSCPSRYRPQLIARQSQIETWLTSLQHATMRRRLIDFAATSRTVMVGLSGRDINIKQIFSTATEELAWMWTSEPQPLVFCEENIESDHEQILRSMYGGDYFPNRQDIHQTSLLGCYATPFLLGLFLFVLSRKLLLLLRTIDNAGLSEQDWIDLGRGIIGIRDEIAVAHCRPTRKLTRGLIRALGFILSMFRYGRPLSGSKVYEPLTAQPMSLTLSDPNLLATGLPMLAMAVALLGTGRTRGLWTMQFGNPMDPDAGTCSLTRSSGAQAKVFFVRDAYVLAAMEGEGYYDSHDSDTVVIHSHALNQRPRRSPRRIFGRAGEKSAREVAINNLVLRATSAEDLLQRFRQEMLM